MKERCSHPADLPTAEEARRELGIGASWTPLPRVPFRETGLLAELPPPPAGRTGWPWTVESPPSARDGAAIAIVTPSYQQGCFLEETIRSVLLQNYRSLEYVVLDGGSTDESRGIIEKYRPWLSFARSAQDRGQGHAINLGFSVCSGLLRGWLNSDDFYLPGALAALAAAAEFGADFFYGDGLSLDEQTGRRTYATAPWVHSRYLHFGGLIFSHSAFWRAEVHEPIWEAMRCNVDGELWLRLIPGRRLCYVPRALGAVRIQPNAKTVHPRHRSAWAEDDAKIWALHGRPPAPRSWLRYEYRYVQRWVAWRRGRALQHEKRRLLQFCGWGPPAQPAS
jgi:glycosyltransferase involved in cell wall biosynthesis